MSATIAYYGGIVTDGLMLYMDAAKRDSYPGFGTNWNSVARGGLITGSLINDPTYSSANGGSIQFDGVDDYVFLPVNFFNHNSGAPFTVSMWFKTSIIGSILFGQQNTNTPDVASGWVPAIYINTNGKIVTSCFWGGNTSNTSTSLTTVTDNIWHNITVTFQSSSHKSYLDGILFDTIIKNQGNYSTIYYYFLATGKFSTWQSVDASPYYNGAISNFTFYIRALSDSEVLQNYNALKGRFGL